MLVHSIIEELRSTTSRKNKQRIMQSNKTNTVFLDVLLYAYSPFKHYFITKIKPVSPSGVLTLTNTYTQWTDMLNALARRHLSGHTAQYKILQYLSTITKEEQEVFIRVLKKDLRCGIGPKLINSCFPALIPDYGAMKAKLLDERRFTPGMYMSLKLDGNRGLLARGAIRSRNGLTITGCEHILDSIPKGFDSLDGELKNPNVHWQISSGDIRSNAKSENQIYYVFDIPNHSGPFEERLKELDALSQALSPDDPIKVIKHKPVYSLHVMYRNFTKALNAGYEGLVLKTPRHLYQTRRTYDWLKVKNTLEEDLPIIYAVEGQGRLKGTLGSIIVERANGVTVSVGSGFSDELRDAIWKDPDAYIGKTAEIQYHEETPSGSLRHPRLSKHGIRLDK